MKVLSKEPTMLPPTHNFDAAFEKTEMTLKFKKKVSAVE